MADSYDCENHLTNYGSVNLAYDGDGNRVSETIGGTTTGYVVDSVNPTGYPQVLEEIVNGAVQRKYTWGHWLLSENQFNSGTWTKNFYLYDGHGSVRNLTDASGNITDSYTYDAFGNLIESSGSTPNNYLFAGEQFDPALNLYYNRARYLNTNTGRFWSMDTDEGNLRIPISLHKYVYVSANPVNDLDQSGQQDEIEELGAESIGNTLNSIDTQIGLGAENNVRSSLGLVIETPQGQVLQEETTEALEVKTAVEEGAPIYRLGTMGTSGAAEAQYWALENPVITPDYALKYGIPPANIENANFVEVGTLRQGSKFVTRVAEDGTAIEVVTEPEAVNLQGFFTFDELTDLTEKFLEFF